MRHNFEFSRPPTPSKCLFFIKNDSFKVLVKLQVSHLVTTHQFLDQILPQALIDKLNNAREAGLKMKRMKSSILDEESFGMAHSKPEAGILNINGTKVPSGSLAVKNY